MDDTPKAIWEGSFTIFGAELECCVLDNGQRIIKAESLAAFFDGTKNGDPGDLADFQRWQEDTPK